jgi:hypothetical protein
LERVSQDVLDIMEDSADIIWNKSETNQHACFEYSRGAGGRLAALQFAAGINSDIRISDHCDSVNQDELHSMEILPHYFRDGTFRHNIVSEKRCSPDWNSWDSLLHLDGERLVLTEIEEWYDRYCAKEREMIDLKGEWGEEEKRKYRLENEIPEVTTVKRDGKINCCVSGVLEPNKCRMISKGEAIPYQKMKPLQRALLKSIQRFSCFKLTGRPFCPTDLYPLVKKANSEHSWHSVDYSAATDCLSWKLSKAIFSKVIAFLPKDYRETALDVLGPHRLYYPSEDGPIYRGDQQNGQLMGSVLSFPILCLANLALYLQCTRDWQKDWSHQERLDHVLVNGDDMLYTSPKYSSNGDNLWGRHVLYGRRVGLEMSIGKAYKHDVYCNINSTSVHFDLRKLPPPGIENRSLYGKGTESPFQVNFLNVGLCLNKHKVQAYTDDDKLEEGRKWEERKMKEYKKAGLDDRAAHINLEIDKVFEHKFVSCGKMFQKMYSESHTHEDSRNGIVENINLAISGALSELSQNRLLETIIKKHEADIKRQTTIHIIDVVTGKRFLMNRNLFLPEVLGGMGVNCPNRFKYKITSAQRHLSHYIMEHSICFEKRPFFRKEEVKSALDRAAEPWENLLRCSLITQVSSLPDLENIVERNG